ncbi:MAG: NAD(P)/FAD-dependent oxidoreductase [Desulfobacterales bacterium]|nr:NAD(P)/FAD-dependent oxidoreductase [Desulfobacterales bacterium]
MEEKMVDVVVIGGGAGGVPAAIRAAQLGGRVCIIESRDLGGQCMNRGCVPYGHMMEASSILGTLALGKDMGISIPEVSKDYAALMDRQNKLLGFMKQGVKSTLLKKKIEIIEGKGEITAKGTVAVNGKKITCKAIILATGATWVKPDFPGADLEDVLNTDYLLTAKSLPARVLLSGRSPWLVGIAQFLQRYGTQAILATPEKRILSNENKTIATRLAKVLRDDGIDVRTRSEVLSISKKKGGLQVDLKSKDDVETISVDKVITLDRRVSVDGLGLKHVGLDEKGEFISVNEKMETQAQGVYAIGDLTGSPENHYSHRASQQGIIAAENAMGADTAFRKGTLTRVLFTRPQVACVGLTEKEAKDAGHDVVVGAAPLSMNTYGMIISESEGLVEVVADKSYGEILGVHFIGKAASEMAGQALLAIEMEATLDALASMAFPHPTLSESLAEAARNALGRHIYLP